MVVLESFGKENNKTTKCTAAMNECAPLPQPSLKKAKAPVRVHRSNEGGSLVVTH